MTNFLVIDFETKSRVDLLTAGTDKYAQDPSTEILCMAAAFTKPDDDREWLWFPKDGPLPVSFLKALVEHRRRGGLVAAWNARFDEMIWECIGVEDWDFPILGFDEWYCLSAQARVNALPANLDDCTRALNAEFRKSHAGKALIRKLCIPQKDGQFYNGASELAELGVYCLDDVRASVDACNRCRVMSPIEHEDWLVNERINDRGIRIDRPLAMAATEYAEVETVAIGKELHQLTGGVVTKHTQNQRIKKWLLPRIPPIVEFLMTVYANGVKKHSLAKDIRAEILNRADSGEIEITNQVYNVIACLDDGNKSSVAKFKRMVQRADFETDRVHGAFMYAGAATLRYTSRGLQVHNFKRDCWTDYDAGNIRSMMLAGHKIDEGTVMETLAKLLRPALIPAPGCKLVVGDWSAIENRALPWLADDPRAEWKLAMFRDDVDTYIAAAADIGSDNRQLGKVIELSFGFGGAKGAFSAMARNYGLAVPEHEVKRLVGVWRRKNSWAEPFWNKLEKSAKLAVRNPGTTFEAGRVSYTFAPGLMDGSLICELPGGHHITYPSTRLNSVRTEYGDQWELTALKANFKPKADAKEWPRFKLWRGLLAENVTQAFCAALLRWALKEVDNVILHCHDEIGIEVPEEEAEKAADHLQRVMEAGPKWAVGLPLTAKPKILSRYGK